MLQELRVALRELHAKHQSSTTSQALGEFPPTTIPINEYLSEERLARERALIEREPTIAAFESEVSEPGDCLAANAGTLPMLLTRDEKGDVRVFRNACRHRGMLLLWSEASPCKRSSLVCPFHAWAYDLQGACKHIPNEDMFGAELKTRRGLHSLPSQLHHGIVWASTDPSSLNEHLGAFDAELGAFFKLRPILFRRSVSEFQANWKLPIDGFLENYHVPFAHGPTSKSKAMNRYATSLFDIKRDSRHIRTISPRRSFVDATGAQLDAAAEDPGTLFGLATLTYYIFPNTIAVFLPESTHIMTFVPLSVSRSRWVHAMLVGARPITDEAKATWDAKFEAMEESFFKPEELRFAEAVQQGYAATADQEMLYGSREAAVPWFHEHLNARL